jgi:hypothetical protein
MNNTPLGEELSSSPFVVLVLSCLPSPFHMCLYVFEKEKKYLGLETRLTRLKAPLLSLWRW